MDIDAKDFVDYATFYVALSSVDELIATLTTAGEEKPTEYSGLDLLVLQNQRLDADRFIRMIAPSLDSAIDILVRDMAEKANLRIKIRIDMALKGSPVSGYAKRRDLLLFFLGRMKAHNNKLREDLEAVGTKATALVRAASLSSPLSRLFEVASIQSASGRNNKLKQWAIKASGLCGNAVSEEEVLANELQEVKSLVDEIQAADRKLVTRDPGDSEAAEIAEVKADLKSTLKEAIEQSSDPNAVKLAVATQINDSAKTPYLTKVGAAIKGGLSPAQEEQVMARGKLIIASGAGSGKTRVLASKVVYHMQELGQGPGSVMAVSFSIKSSAELKKRVFDYAEKAGLNLPKSGDYPGFGTTHAIARMVLNSSGRYRISAGDRGGDKSESAIKGGELNKLIKVAIEQVKMSARSTPSIPKDAMTFFPNLGNIATPSINNESNVKAPIDVPVQEPSPIEVYLEDANGYASLIDTALQALRSSQQGVLKVEGKSLSTRFGPKTLITIRGPGVKQFYNELSRMRTPDGNQTKYEKANPQYRTPDQFQIWAGPNANIEATRAFIDKYLGLGTIQNSIDALLSLKGKDPKDITDSERGILQTIVTQPVVASKLKSTNMAVKTAADENGNEPAFEDSGEMDAYEAQGIQKMKQNTTDPYYYWLNNPAGQWFNIGASASDFEKEDDKGTKKKVPLSVFARFIGINKNTLVAPGQTFVDAEKPQDGASAEDDEREEQEGGVSSRILAAVYGAYEWLKTNSTPTKGRLDYDDQLIQAARVLSENPQLLKRLQTQYKTVLIDEAQDLNKCVHGDTVVTTRSGTKMVKDLTIGEDVLSLEAGRIEFHRILAKADSSWTRGYRITTATGRTLTMSPDHQIYATDIERVPEGQMALYMMYRKDMGFRLGTSTRPTHRTKGGSNSRAAAEHADAMWILEMGTPEDILYKEQAYSLKYGVPTYIYEGYNHGCDQPRIDKLFQEFGKNGLSLLQKYDLDPRFPHWTNSTNTRGKVSRRIVTLQAHRGKLPRGSFVSIEWTGEAPPDCGAIYNVKNGRKLINRYFRDYQEARDFAVVLAAKFNGTMTETLYLNKEKLTLITASSLYPGMMVPVQNGSLASWGIKDMLHITAYREMAAQLGLDISDLKQSKSAMHERIRETQEERCLSNPLPPIKGSPVSLDGIVTVEPIEGGTYFDITVDKAGNFFGNGILSHNCQHIMFGMIAGYIDPSNLKPRTDGKTSADTFAYIGDDKQAIFEFRGALPDEFIRKSDLVPGGEGFKTLLMEKNYRSGSKIVDAANKLISFNSKQIPMTCTTDPSRGEGSIQRRQVGFADEGPGMMVELIQAAYEEAKANGENLDGFYKKYGLAARTNSELIGYQMAMIGAGIPFRSKRNPLDGPATGPIVALFKLFLPGTSVKDRNDSFVRGMSAPYFGMSPHTVKKKLSDLGAGDFYRFCEEGGYKKLYSGSDYRDRFVAYLDYLKEIKKLSESGGSAALLNFILDFRGPDGQNFGEQLAIEIKNSPEQMDEAQLLADEAELDEVTDSILIQQALKPVSPLFGVAARYPQANDFVEYVNSLSIKNDRNNKTDDEDAEGTKNLITVDTVHGWKGLECDHLFLPMSQGQFPHKRSMGSDKLLESERRLAYVAFTRGRDSVTIIEPTMRQKGDKVVPIEPSQFVGEACIQSQGVPATSQEVAGDEDVDERDAEDEPTSRMARVKKALRTGQDSMFLMPILEKTADDDLIAEEEPEEKTADDDLIAAWEAGI